MSVKTVLVSLNEVNRVDQMVLAAVALAKKFEVHIVGLYVVPAVEIYPTAGMQLSTQVEDSHRRFYLNHAKNVRKKFETAMEKEGLSAEWVQRDSPTSSIADGVIERACMSDLVVLPQSRVDNDSGMEDEFNERVIMESGRPVLIFPAFGDFESFGEKPLVAWNGTRESARAIFDAMPLFGKTADVKVSWLNARKDQPDLDLPGAEMALVVTRHGFNVTAEAIPTADLPVGEALLSHASDISADLLVMGGYGHSRLREYIFGGATRTILESMTVPVLMSH
jgi:nucleotide-binding universal stress UspA family protein